MNVNEIKKLKVGDMVKAISIDDIGFYSNRLSTNKLYKICDIEVVRDITTLIKIFDDEDKLTSIYAKRFVRQPFGFDCIHSCSNCEGKCPFFEECINL